jgi:hypothetical protein
MERERRDFSLFLCPYVSSVVSTPLPPFSFQNGIIPFLRCVVWLGCWLVDQEMTKKRRVRGGHFPLPIIFLHNFAFGLGQQKKVFFVLSAPVFLSFSFLYQIR